MSDLQCPATIVLLTEQSVGTSELRELRLARVVYAADSGSEGAARELARVHDCDVEAASGMDGPALGAQIEALADAYRGESVAIVTTARAVCAALRRSQAPAVPVVLAVDSGGWNVLSG
jgi:hypothetical protein